MTVLKAFAVWKAAQKLVKDCGKENCKPCGLVRYKLRDIEMGTPILMAFDFYKNDERGLPSLEDECYKGGKKWMKEVERRLEMIRKEKSNEELPAELFRVFEELEVRMKKHPAIED